MSYRDRADWWPWFELASRGWLPLEIFDVHFRRVWHLHLTSNPRVADGAGRKAMMEHERRLRQPRLSPCTARARRQGWFSPPLLEQVKGKLMTRGMLPFGRSRRLRRGLGRMWTLGIPAGGIETSRLKPRGRGTWNHCGTAWLDFSLRFRRCRLTKEIDIATRTAGT
jgi:hypothetical protein